MENYQTKRIIFLMNDLRRLLAASDKLSEVVQTSEYVACCDGDFQCLNLLNDANNAMRDLTRCFTEFRREYTRFAEDYPDTEADILERLRDSYPTVDSLISYHEKLAFAHMKSMSEYYTGTSEIQQSGRFCGKKAAPVKKGWFK